MQYDEALVVLCCRVHAMAHSFLKEISLLGMVYLQRKELSLLMGNLCKARREAASLLNPGSELDCSTALMALAT